MNIHKNNKAKPKNKNLIIPLLSICFSVLILYILFRYFPFKNEAIYILGFSFFSVGLINFLVFSTSLFLGQENYIFFLFLSIIFTSTGIPFLISQLNLLDFLFYIGIGVGLILIISGIYWKLFGLLIPGSIIIGVMPGLYFAWENTNATNALEQTAVMLVWFAFGWGLITILSRMLTKNFVWWPLIPGGILAVVGWGLFIAGNPKSAIGFIGNTGSIGLIIFGIYILLMRQSFNK
ncbi:MAG TPA: hypothetical protein DCP10_07595 [Bacteroidales bacterium]|nr:hypothetical protein [Bacteroidales bacterium]